MSKNYEKNKKILFYIILAILILMTALSSYFILNYKNFVSPLHANYNLTVMIYNKKLTLLETITWKIYAKKYKVLLKKWDEPLVLNENFNQISSHAHVRVVKQNSTNAISFIKQYDGKSYLMNENAASVTSLPNIDVSTTGILPMGLINNSLFNPNKYSLTGMYYFIPQAKADQLNKLVKLDVGYFDYPIDDVTIIIKGKLFDDAFSNLLNQEIQFNDDHDKIIIHGNLYHQKLQLALLTKSSAVFTGFFETTKRNEPLKAFTEYEKMLKKMSISKSVKYNFTKNLNTFYEFLVLILIFMIPAVFYLLFYSANKNYDVELDEEIYDIPNPDYQPWQVNLLFSNNLQRFKTDQNALLSVLLQLNGNYIKMDGNRIIILSDDFSDLDEYQSKVLKWLIKHAENDVIFIPTLVKKLINLKRSKSNEIKELRNLLYYVEKDSVNSVFDFTEYRAINNKLFFPLLTLVFLLPILPNFVFNKMLLQLDVVLFFSKIAIIYVILSFIMINLFAKKLFTHISKDAKLDALKWQEFKSFLQSPALIKSHLPTDVNKWKEWLYYAIAFGIDKQFEKSMRENHIIISELNVISKYRTFVLLLKKIVD